MSPWPLCCWAVSLAAGLLGRLPVVVATIALTLISWLVTDPRSLLRPIGWVELPVFTLIPWLLWRQRSRFEALERRLQEAEAARLARLHELNQSAARLQQDNGRLEAQITDLAELYHVTKETSRARRVDELFSIALGLLPRLIRGRNIRLIDLSRSADGPVAFRGRVQPDGRPVLQRGTDVSPLEVRVIERVRGHGRGQMAGWESAEDRSGRTAWIALRAERRPIGLLLADDVPEDQLDRCVVIANQLALQLARVHLYQRIESMAITDALTGLYVRRYFLALAAEELERSQRHGLSCAMLLVDLDHFKQKNDTYGHLVGDVVLHEVAQLMHKNLRGIDLIARYGGEEFMLLLIETDAEPAAVIAERLRQLVAASQIRAYDETISQTISVGLAAFPADGTALEQLIDRADQALYAAKRRGRNQVMRWTEQSPVVP